MGKKRGRIQSRVEAEGDDGRGQAGGDFRRAGILGATDEVAQQGSDQEVGNGRRSRRGLHAHDVPRALRETVEELVQQARFAHAGVGHQRDRLRLPCRGAVDRC